MDDIRSDIVAGEHSPPPLHSRSRASMAASNFLKGNFRDELLPPPPPPKEQLEEAAGAGHAGLGGPAGGRVCLTAICSPQFPALEHKQGSQLPGPLKGNVSSSCIWTWQRYCARAAMLDAALRGGTNGKCQVSGR
eukprot:jgi/Mesen1/3715/ME000202S02805